MWTRRNQNSDIFSSSEDNSQDQQPQQADFPSSTQSPRRRRFILAPLIIALLFIAFQYFSAETYVNPVTGKKVRVAISPEQESALGLQSFNEILSQSQVIEQGPEYEMVLRVVNKLVQQVDDVSKNFDWAVSVIQSEQLNAFCLPGGKIAVYTGILPIAQNDSGLATVLGHEIAHATARHGAQRIFQQQLVQTGLQGVSGTMGEMDPRQRQTIMGLLGAGVQFGLVLPYGRDHELEADEMGLKYMTQAGYDPEETIRFWERMSEAGGGKNPPEFASTHPSHGSRIERLRELIRKAR